MKPHQVIGTRYGNVFEVDTKKSSYNGVPWNELGGWAKKKFENYALLDRVKDGVSKVTYNHYI